MRASASASAGLFLIAALGASCGADPEPPQLGIAFQDRALLEEAAAIAFYFYDEPIACTTLRATTPRPRAALGPYQEALTPETQSNGLLFSLDRVPVGTYVVLADALTAGGGVIGSACAEGQQIYEHQRSNIFLTVSRNP
ncbi:MAG: hypothetical protein IT384_13060 [Deltaproteobacteria bacterium]|nr:hypothetical protein [Deltaproteobacteria bacterium]